MIGKNLRFGIIGPGAVALHHSIAINSDNARQEAFRQFINNNKGAYELITDVRFRDLASFLIDKPGETHKQQYH